VTFVKKNFLLTLVLAFTALNIFLWFIVYAEQPVGILKVAFLDIGQGDAIYIESPTHIQMLIDGGPPRKILSELGAVMPFYDRTIDILMVTNPDKDHIGGFIDVLGSYTVKEVIQPGTKNPSDTYAELERSIDTEPAKETLARRGQIIDLGGGAYFEVFFPDKDVSDLKTNDGSIIGKLVYGSTSIMFTGDAPNSMLEYTTSLNPSSMDSDILKAGHHGSRTSASEMFIKAVSPQYAVISAAAKNSYGHPHKETTDLFKKLNVTVYGTYERGRIEFVSDGKTFTLE
jgi:competence protein ComEC